MKTLQKDKNKLNIIHLLDSIYYGHLNNSYQKEGFGIQQNFEFHTYIGYWKSNRIEGLGLIILESGEVVYGNFKHDEIDGLAIIDNGSTLRCGVYKNSQIIGVGYEYNYGAKNWKMSRYHKGIAIELLKEETCDLAHELPIIIKIEQSIYFHLYNYIHRKYFPSLPFEICQVYIKQIKNQSQTYEEVSLFHYGIQNENGRIGPGVAKEEYKVVEAGFYENGELNGFGFQRSIGSGASNFEFGCYNRGRRDGLFVIKDSEKNRVFEYRKGAILKNSSESEEQIFKNQRKYNFNRKDFFSAKNNIDFRSFKSLTIPLEVRIYQNKNARIAEEKQAAVKQQPYRRFDIEKRNMDLIIRDKREKSCVQIMKEKISHHYGIVSSAKKRRESIESQGKVDLEKDNEEDHIAIEENPFEI